MSTLFMSSKGGNCTTVTATAFALIAAQRGQHTVLIDLCGDIPSVVGMTEPASPGVNDWLAESSTADAQALVTSGTPFAEGLVVVHRGARFVEGEPRWDKFVEAISSLPMNIVIDAGIGHVPDALRHAVDAVTMVVKPCYLSLRRAARLPHPTNVFVIDEPGRALTVKDVGHVIGSPVAATIPYNPAIGRAVDAGLLPSRVTTLFGPYFSLSPE